jgi:RNA polymerase sigma-70 factor (ECF subfamily)
MAGSDEDVWIEAARSGNLDAFNQLVLAYQGQVYALAYRLLGDRDSAADVSQETFLAAFRHIDRFQKGSLRAWLLRIAANLCYDTLRRQRARPTSSLAILFTRPDSPELHQTEGAGADPEEYVEQHELAGEIQRGLGTLPPEQRLVVVLCDVEGFPYEEAARMVNISLGTLKSRLSRGRARLREYFFDHRELLPPSLRSILGNSADSPAATPAGRPEETHESGQ